MDTQNTTRALASKTFAASNRPDSDEQSDGDEAPPSKKAKLANLL